MSEEKHNAVLSIAGYDPSGGAGVLADCKVFEALGKYGCAVSTSITYQNDIKFYGVKWLLFEEIKKQFIPLTERFEFKYAKIGLIENLDVLSKCIVLLKEYYPSIKIIWDPIIKASAGFEFHSDIDKENLFSILKELYLVTPNLEESKILFPYNFENAISICNILVKDCEPECGNAVDTLFYEGKTHVFTEKKLNGYEKHGSGCVLSAAITSYLDKENSDLVSACADAKKYTKDFLFTSEKRIGYHHAISY